MGSLTSKLNKRFYGKKSHPYKIYLEEIVNRLPNGAKVLDAGCGHDAPVISDIAAACDIAVGADITYLNPCNANPSVKFIINDLSAIGLCDACLDMVISRSVMEHIKTPEDIFNEINRILKPGGYFIFLTPNLYDYASIFSKLIPNRFHPLIVKMTEGRNEDDTFPAYYKANTRRDIQDLASGTGFEIKEIEFLGQYPAYLMFNPFVFLIGTAYDRMVCRFNCLAFLRGWILGVLQKL
ncbi:class I SAM-dependent methyltransferase [Desulfobacula phenolica]|uniref:Methyltransferase domain-containing protein n=1 Tax=Desulfobacula phenolica TaxID=90732 RepID=A0A1H2EP25_9BACT|nr:class I SAM-dependent methyltransferase [Desulfobacula phenolica]SDT96855.1 Methyltransferase domain-containing protein [Desulfobacula phenolica]